MNIFGFCIVFLFSFVASNFNTMKDLIQINNRRTVNGYSNDLIDQIDSLVEKHNIGKSFEEEYYIIDLTGRHQVYFTLYKYTKPREGSGYKNPYKYIKNISTDVEKAFKDILSKAGKTPIIACADDNNNVLVSNFRARTKEGIPTIPIGKYKGNTLDSVWEHDKNYVFWFKQNYKAKPYEFNGRLINHKITAIDSMLLDQAQDLIHLFFEEMTEKNRAEDISQHIGQLKQRITIQLTVNKVKMSNRNGEISFEFICLDNDNNRVRIYSDDSTISTGDVITVTGTVTKHFEMLGRKTTYLNRIKISK